MSTHCRPPFPSATHVDLYDSHETEDGYIIFRHRTTGHLQLQDPQLNAIVSQIGRECDRIVYATYRMAAKMTALARALHTSQIPYATITNIMERHRLRHTDNAPLVRAGQLTVLLHDIFYAAEKMGLTNDPSQHHYPMSSSSFSIDGAVATMANLMWNVFDPDRNRPLSVLQLKQTFLLLCQPAAHHDRLIYEHFLLAADHNGCVSRLRFESLVVVMSQLFRYIDPAAAAERFACEHIDALVHGCFAHCPGPMGLNKMQFYAMWQQRQAPAPFEAYAGVYAAVVRMAEARDVLHLGVACVACGQLPVRGLLFRCIQCKQRQVQMCFGCFGSGATTNLSGGTFKHESGHRMEEISRSEALMSGAPSRWQSFGHKLCAIFALCAVRKSKNEKHNAEDDGDNVTMETHVMEMGGIGQKSGCLMDAGHLGRPAEAAHLSTTLKRTLMNQNQSWSSCGSRITDSSEQQHRLSAILASLSSEHEKLLGWMEEQQRGSIRRRSCEFLLAHQQALASAVLSLRKMQSNGKKREANGNVPYCSTPHRASKKRSSAPMFALTPSGSTSLGDINEHSSNLAMSIKGADMNRSYLEASNMSDLSELSSWFQLRRSKIDTLMRRRPIEQHETPPTINYETLFDADMTHFKKLLGIVKEIIDDTYSDNAELSQVTTELERALGQIIDAEELKRIRMIQNTDSIRV